MIEPRAELFLCVRWCCLLVQVMLPVYKCNKYNAWFFVVFLAIATYFLLNLTLAVTIDAFKELTKHKVTLLPASCLLFNLLNLHCLTGPCQVPRDD